MVAPIIAGKGAERASKALTGDVYVKRWTSVKGKGKKKKEVDHELHINPLMLLGAAVAGGVAVTGTAVGLWLTQRKLGRADAKRTVRFVRYYDAVYEMRTPDYTTRSSTFWALKSADSIYYIDRQYTDDPVNPPYPAPEDTTWSRVWTKTIYISGGIEYASVADIPLERVLVSNPSAIVFSKNNIPVTFVNSEGKRYYKWVSPPEMSSTFYLSPRDKAIGWEHDNETPILETSGFDRFGEFKQYAVTLRNRSKKPFTIDDRKGFLE